MSDKTPQLIAQAAKRGSVFLRFDGKPGDVRVVSKGGCSLRLEANKVYEVDLRNPILSSYSLKRSCLVFTKPRLVADVKEQMGKHVSAKNLQNTFTAFKAKTVDEDPIEEPKDDDELDKLLNELEGGEAP